MKILFVNSPSFWAGRKRPVFPLGLASIATLLKNKGLHDIDLIDLNTSDNHYDTLLTNLRKCRYDMIGISFRNAYYFNIPQIRNLSEIIKLIKNVCPDIPLVIGGSGFSLFPKEIMNYINEIDFGVWGEGEDAVWELIQNNFNPVNGLLYRSNGKIMSPDQPRKSNYEELPIPKRDWPGLELNAYKWIGMQIKRGCLFNCTHCHEPFFSRNELQKKSFEKICEELDYLSSIGKKKIFILDNHFNYPDDFYYQVVDQFAKTDLEFAGFFRCSNISSEIIKVAAEAHFKQIYISLESGSSKIINNLQLGFDLKQIKNSIEVCSKNEKVKIDYQFMIGLPSEGIIDILKTCKLSFYILFKNNFRSRFFIEPLAVYPYSKISNNYFKYKSLDNYPLFKGIYMNYFKFIELVQKISEKINSDTINCSRF